MRPKKYPGNLEDWLLFLKKWEPLEGVEYKGEMIWLLFLNNSWPC